MTTIAHATAMTDDDLLPCRHAVALAAHSKARLVSVHATDGSWTEEQKLEPHTLTDAWGLPAVEHEWLMHQCCDDPVDTTLDALRKLAPDLVVAGTHQRGGLARIFKGSHGEAIAENINVPTLLVPVSARGFVDDDGPHPIRRMVIPCGDPESGRIAMDRAVWLAELSGSTEVEVVLLHAGAEEKVPTIETPDAPGFTWVHRNIAGSVEDVVPPIAEEADVIVMATRGQDSAGDAMLGTHTERVLRKVHRPMLSIPIP